MSDDDESFRAMKTEKGVPTTPCTVTPLPIALTSSLNGEPPLPKLTDNFAAPPEHWIDAETRIVAELTARFKAHGIDMSHWNTGQVGISVKLNVYRAALELITKLETKPDA